MKWCNRALIVSQWHYCLVTTQKEFDKILKKQKISETVPDDERLANAAATVSFFTSDKGAKIAIVMVGKGFAKYNRITKYALLVHEGTHIWQAVRELMCEDTPSSEFEAYCIQKIAQELMLAYERAVKKGGKK